MIIYYGVFALSQRVTRKERTSRVRKHRGNISLTATLHEKREREGGRERNRAMASGPQYWKIIRAPLPPLRGSIVVVPFGTRFFETVIKLRYVVAVKVIARGNGYNYARCILYFLY